MIDTINFNDLKDYIGKRSAGSSLSNYEIGSHLKSRKMNLSMRLVLEFNNEVNPNYDIQKDLISALAKNGKITINIREFYSLNESDFLIKKSIEELIDDEEKNAANSINTEDRVIAIRNYVMDNTITRYKTIKKEKGRHTCYLTFYLLQGVDKHNRESKDLKMPIILIPIDIKKNAFNDEEYIISLEQSGDIAINPVILGHYGTFEDNTNKIADLYYVDRNIWIDNYFNDDRLGYLGKGGFIGLGSERGSGILGELERVFLKSKNFKKYGFNILEHCTIGIYDFKTYLIHSDYLKNQKYFEESPNIKILTGKQSSTDINNKFIYPREDYSIYPSDATQSYAISIVRNTGSAFLQGPPGTGKSQTIVNLIAQFMAEGKKVLFITEKVEALNVVYERLKKDEDGEIGLDTFCLKITDDSSKFMTPRRLIDQLKKAKDKLNTALKKSFQYYEAIEEISDNIINYYYKVNENDILNRLYGKLLSLKYSKTKNIESKSNTEVKEIPVEILNYNYNPKNPTIPLHIKIAIENLFSEYPLSDKKFIKDSISFSTLVNIKKIVEDNYSGNDLYNKLSQIRDLITEMLKNYFKDNMFKTLSFNDFNDFIKEIAPNIDKSILILEKKNILQEILNIDDAVLKQVLNSIYKIKKHSKEVSGKYNSDINLRKEFNIPENIKEYDVKKAFDIINSLKEKVISFSEEKIRTEIENYKKRIANFREFLNNTRKAGDIITSFIASTIYNANNFYEIISMTEILYILTNTDIKHYIPEEGLTLDSRKIKLYIDTLSKIKEINDIKKEILYKFQENSKYGLPENLSIQEINKKIPLLKTISYKIREELDELEDKSIKKALSSVFNLKSKERQEIVTLLKKKFAKKNINNTIRDIINNIESINKLTQEVNSSLSESDVKKFSNLEIVQLIKLHRGIDDIYHTLKSIKNINYKIDVTKIISNPNKVEELLNLKANLKNPVDALKGILNFSDKDDFDFIEKGVKEIENDILLLEKYFGDKGVLENYDVLNLKRYVENKINTDKQIENSGKTFKSILGERLYKIIISDIDNIEDSLIKINKIFYSKLFISQKNLSIDLINNFIKLISSKNRILGDSKAFINLFEEIKDYINNIDKITSEIKLSSLPNKLSGITGKKSLGKSNEKKEHLRLYINIEKEIKNIEIKNFSSILFAGLQSGKFDSTESLLDGITKHILVKEINKFEKRNKIIGNISNDIKKFIDYERKRMDFNRSIIPYKLKNYYKSCMNNDNELRELIYNLDTKLTFKRHTELRSAFDEVYPAALVLTPCWMMTPNIVSLLMKDPSHINPDYKGKFLSDKDRFDLVIFDEASQIRIEDAVPSLARAKQFIVIGDDKQLPPSKRFERGEKNMRSLMHEIQNVISVKLSWHYRSLSEELINFSDKNYYHSSLIYYPTSFRGSDYGINLIEVEGEWDERKNKIEAEKAIQLLKTHINKNKTDSIGIVTINEEQKKYIIKTMGNLYLKNCGGKEIFVKNIENVQGDERDVIILSIAYTGKTKSFGELSFTGEGRKRLNVAITRARKKMYVLASPKLINLNLEETQEGHHLIDFLRYCDKITKQKAESGELIFKPTKDKSQVFKSEIASYLSSLDTTKTMNQTNTTINHGEKDKEIHVVYKANKDYHAIMTDHDNGKLLVPDDDVDDRYSLRDREITIQHILTERGWKYHRITCQDSVKQNIKKKFQ